MGQEPSAKSSADTETRPSLLATMTLVLAVVPFVLAAQFILIELGYLPVWLGQTLSHIMPLQMLVMLISPFISIICGLKASSKMKLDRSLQGERTVRAGVYLAVIFFLGLLFTLLILPC